MKSHIVVHHSLTKDGMVVNTGAIRDYHKNVHKWNDIGYHYLIELVGDEYEVFVGRMPDQPGAHCKELGMNTRGYGVCLVGNFDLAPPPDAQMDKLIELLRYLMRQDHIPVFNVLGHREVGIRAGFDWTKGEYKTCPGIRFDMMHLRDLLNNGV